MHERAGAAILRPEPESLRITGTAPSGKSGSGCDSPRTGVYTFPGGLAPLTIHDGVGSYWEPNVWMHHSLRTL